MGCTFLFTSLLDEFILIIVMIGSFALILGLIKARSLFTIIGGVLLLRLLYPFIVSIVESLPWWIHLFIYIILFMYILRMFLTLFLGAEGAGTFLGLLAYSVLAIPFIVLRAIFRLILTRGQR